MKKRSLFLAICLVLLLSVFKVFANQSINIISTGTLGTKANGDCQKPKLSNDGKHIVFESAATNLVDNDTNNATDIFLKNIETGEIKRVSVDSSNNEANGASEYATLSANGEFVVFESSAKNLVNGTNTKQQIFIKNTSNGEIRMISTSSSEVQGNFSSYKPSISEDGKFIAFYSTAKNLVLGDTNNYKDIFIKNTQTGETKRVSTDSSGIEASNESINPVISSDGNYVAFESKATNLVSDDSNNKTDIFIKNVTSGEITLISSNSTGNQADGNSIMPSISSNGRFVAFESTATNLVSDDTNKEGDIFVKDLQTNIIARISTDSSGNQSSIGYSHNPNISPDSKYIAFDSYASNLVPDDTNNEKDVFIKEIETNKIIKIGQGEMPSITNSNLVAFQSAASNLVEDDLNNKTNIFLTNFDFSKTEIIDPEPAPNPEQDPVGQSLNPIPSTSQKAPQVVDKTAPLAPLFISLFLNTKYYRNANQTFSWVATDSSGIKGYSHLLDKQPLSNPKEINYGISTTKNYKKIGNGHWYFHVRAVDNFNNWSKASHLGINIDTYKPRISKTKKVKVRQEKIGKIYYKVSDPYTGGKANITIKIKKLTKKRVKRKVKMIWQTIKVKRLGLIAINKLKSLKYRANLTKGEYKYFIYAKDQAGNNQYNVASNRLIIY